MEFCKRQGEEMKEEVLFLGRLGKMVTFVILTQSPPHSPCPSPGQLSVETEGFLLLSSSMGFPGICLSWEPQLSPLNWLPLFHVPSNPIPSNLHPDPVSVKWAAGLGLVEMGEGVFHFPSFPFPPTRSHNLQVGSRNREREPACQF